MKLSVYTIKNTLFAGEVDKVIAKTAMGEITVLENHLPLITLLKGPALETEKKGKRNVIPVKSGFLEVRPESEVVVLADS